MNSVVLIGRLTKKPEIRYTQSQMAVSNFTLAVDRQFKKEGQPTADFIRIMVFGKVAENGERFLDKGSRVGVQGRIQTGSYKTQTGETRYTTDVVADRVEFLDGGNQSGSAAGVSAPTDDPSGYGGIPEGFQSVSDDDIPF